MMKLVASFVAAAAAEKTYNCYKYRIKNDYCDQRDYDCVYFKYATKGFGTGFASGECAPRGYSVKLHTKTKSVPKLGVVLFTSYYEGFTAAVNMTHEFEMEIKDTLPFQNFSASYVKMALDEGVDWSLDKRGVVTSNKNQKNRAYCGTFSKVAAAEGQYALHSGQPARNLSVEQALECGNGFIYGEGGGMMAWEDYPYTHPAKDKKPACKYDESKVVKNYAKGVTGKTSPSKQGEDQVAAFIHHNGPVGCAVRASVFKLKDADGFVTAEACKDAKRTINHSVLCVGFGVDPVKGPYWKIKNSWGKKFGDGHGFLKIARGKYPDSSGELHRCGNLGGTFGAVPVYGPVAGYYEASEDINV